MTNRATTVAALGGAGGALAGSAADALFLAHVGAARLGLALAASSALLAIVLSTVGRLADRVDRRRLLASVAGAAAVGAALLAVIAGAAPAVAGVMGLVVVKQLQAAVDLGFWVVIADQLDARQARREVPRLAAAQGLGAAAGALVVVPLAQVGVAAVLAAAAVCYVATAIAATGLEVGRRVAARPAAERAPVGATPAPAGFRIVRRTPLGESLALVVAIAGAFSMLAFYILGAASASVGGDRDIAQFLGTVRFFVQLATLGAQLVIAPRLLDRLGVGGALVLAPAAAVACTLGYEVSGALAAAVAVQSQARLLDAAIEAPAEKLALGLVPAELRGRVGGFLEGSAKRAGAIAGGLAAMALSPWPRALGAVMLVVALVWLALAARLRRRLPRLALAALASPRADADALADPRTIALVEAELEAGAARAAEILARLHARGRVDAVPALARAIATVSDAARPTVAAALVACAEKGGKGDAIAWAAAHPDDPSAELVIRAAGLCGGDASGLSGTVAKIATLRARGEDPAAAIDDALDDGDVALAVREARAELVRRGTLDAARRLVRALRRCRDDGALAAGLDALADVPQDNDAAWMIVRADLIDLARKHVDGAPPRFDNVRAAAIRLLGALGTDARALVDALGDRDDDVRDAAEDALRRLGAAATGELVEAAAYGRRAGRDRAVALLADLPVTEAALDRMIDAELDVLERTRAHRASLADRPLVARRLDERADELGATALLLCAARHRSASLAACARLWRHAPDADTRARAIEIADAALPRAIAVRVGAALEGRTSAPAPQHEAIEHELAGADRLARMLLVHALGAAGRARYRDAIAGAARDAARDLSPLALLRRITGAEDEDADDDVPTQVETLLLLGNVPLLAGLTTRQLAELAEAARWEELAEGDVAVAAGEVCDALLVVASGELRAGERVIQSGQVVDDLAVVAPAAAAASIVAATPTRLLRLARVDFEERVDDVAGLAAAVCRTLGARARHVSG